MLLRGLQSFLCHCYEIRVYLYANEIASMLFAYHWTSANAGEWIQHNVARI